MKAFCLYAVIFCLFVVLFCSSCQKSLQSPTADPTDGTAVLPGPIHIWPINLDSYPVQAELNSFPRNGSNVDTFLVQEQNSYTEGGMVGFVFRSAVAGNINELGMLYPETGAYWVYVWDSVSQQLLTQATVQNNSTSQFTYTNLPSNINILANHPYVVGLYTTPGNTYNYLLDLSETDNEFSTLKSFSLTPFTQGNITVERGFADSYVVWPTLAYLASFPSMGNGFFTGFVDVGFF